MSIRAYLPSTKLTSIVISLALSAGLVYAADAVTHPPAPQVSVTDTPSVPAGSDTGWEAALYAIQSQTASTTLPATDPSVVDNLIQAAQSANVTETVGKTLLINLTNAKSQGLGDDIPTQDQIVAQATAQLKNQQASVSAYTVADLTVVTVSDASLRAYGNGVMAALAAHPQASEQATLLAIDYIVEGGDSSKTATLAAIGDSYKAAATDLLALPVPQTLAPFHLEMVNDLLATGATYTDMQSIGSDPVRGLAALQTYESLLDDGARVFTNVAQELSKDGILFTKDEPGNAWGIFLTPTASPGSSQ